MRHIVIAVVGTPILTALLLGVVLAWSDGAPALGSPAQLVVATDTSTPTDTPTDTPTPADTPTGTPTPTATYAPPTWVPSALVIQGMWITLETGGSCAFTSTTLGVEVTVTNTGATAAGPFVVDVNGGQQSVPDLGAGQTLTLWFSGYLYSGSETATDLHQRPGGLPVDPVPPGSHAATDVYADGNVHADPHTDAHKHTHAGAWHANVVAGSVCRGPYDPNFCAYLYTPSEVTLQPLGWQTATDYHGHFQFDGVPDGQYTLVLSPSCLTNAVGGTSCYAPLDVGVSGGGVYVTWKPCPDSDCDGVSDLTDNCPNVYNPDQLNTDAGNTGLYHAGADALGDACDPDISGDGYGNVAKTALGKSLTDYCPIMRADVDGDGVVTILDLSKTAMKFGQTLPTDPAAGIDTGVQRLNQDADNVISILDLTKQAMVFGQPVTQCP